MSGPYQLTVIDRVEVHLISMLREDGAYIVFSLNDNMISVCVSPHKSLITQAFPFLRTKNDRLQDHFVKTFIEGVQSRNREEYEQARTNCLNVILAAGRHHFPQWTSSPDKSADCEKRLSDLLFPQVIYFRLEAAKGRATIVPISPDDVMSRVVIDPVLDRGLVTPVFNLGLPWFTPEQIIVKQILYTGAAYAIAEVQVVNRKESLLCKASGSPGGGIPGPSLRREAACLGKILRAFSIPKDIRLPRLFGYVSHKDTKEIIGFLRQWVPGRKLSEIDITSVEEETRQKWISQIRETFDQLHKKGIVWGDPRPGSVVIDENGDAWLTEFARGWWKDMEMKETKEGDEHSLAEVIELLK
ncbi:uncharacterized protein BKA55DRAFT_589229 [Fusarium redolens]|uniref:Protein kinase domain-containing protein n=1 Tax=Fusarium redolens TaxID=48865 RepID=A0A9P9R9S4_FUSRE|nr:uncharacterized protein BKA55DRAFT_589229 [Fusarium redolens]KAH7270879.1 hypothetical protein BKA55DRAFT_589229 [Fusarium redolens]